MKSLPTRGVAVSGPTSKFTAFSFNRREPGPNDILIDIHFCGICHSDIHQVRNEWKGSSYPMVPGHEIAGIVTRVGSKVKKFRVGDQAGVGCFVDSCRKCEPCKSGEENYCDGHASWTYNGTEQDQKTPTYGGYSSQITVDENYALKISKSLPLDKAAPLLCAGITTYSPLKHFGVKKGDHVGVVGMGGLGHMGVKLAASMGANVTVFSTSKAKEKDAKLFGAKEFVLSSDAKKMAGLAGKFDFILDTVAAPHDLNLYLGLLKRDKTMVIVGVPDQPASIHAFTLIGRRKRLAGSVIGGIKETQEMLDYCAKHKVTPEIEKISVKEIEKAYERTIKSDVRYRFVIDLKTL